RIGLAEGGVGSNARLRVVEQNIQDGNAVRIDDGNGIGVVRAQGQAFGIGRLGGLESERERQALFGGKGRGLSKRIGCKQSEAGQSESREMFRADHGSVPRLRELRISAFS